jgi:hypothetical protein
MSLGALDNWGGHHLGIQAEKALFCGTTASGDGLAAA